MRLFIAKGCCGLFLLILLILPRSLGAQSRSAEADSGSPRQFVEEFYKWYSPRALSENATAAWNVATKYKSSALTRELVELLRQDSAAQARCEELVGLDFDPFLNSQDPANRYEVGGISHKGQRYRVDIHSVQTGKRSEEPDVSVELVKSNGQWFFVNFFYPDGTDLLTILKSPRPECSVPRPAKQESQKRSPSKK